MLSCIYILTLLDAYNKHIKRLYLQYGIMGGIEGSQDQKFTRPRTVILKCSVFLELLLPWLVRLLLLALLLSFSHTMVSFFFIISSRCT